MGFRSKLPLFFFFLLLSVTTLALAQATEQEVEAEFQECQRHCQQQQEFGRQKEQQQCQQRCVEQRREQQERQREQGGGERSQDPQREYQQCRSRCQDQERRGSPRYHQCQQQCEERRREQEERQQGGQYELTSRDPQREYQQCQSRCQEQEQQGIPRRQQQQCQQRCDDRRREQEQRQQGGQDDSNPRDIQQEYQQCQQRCQEQEQRSPRQQQQQCQQRCEDRRREQEREQQQRDPREECQRICQQQEQGQTQKQQQQCQQRCEEERRRQGGRNSQQEREQQQRDNPYFLDEQSFVERFRTQHGFARISQRFSQISSLLRGIENYRLGQFEANPSTFMIPHHFDADAIFVVVRGRGTINLIQQQRRDQQPNKETYNLERGDVIRVPAGALIYLINRDNNDRFQIVSLFRPVSTPTNSFREFFAVGGRNPESFFNTFSDDILQAAFNVPRERIDRLFRQQNQGEIIQASQEQIKALSRDASRQGSPRHGSQSRGPYRLLSNRPEHSNEYGTLHTVGANEYQQLQDLDVEVACYNITKGTMLAPFYNSRSTSLVMVVDGSGRLEMACPHLGSSQSQGQSQGRQERGSSQEREQREQQQEQGSTHYQQVRASLSPRTAFVIPAGHPISIVASDNQNLQFVAFKINAENNQRNYLAGQNNVLNRLEREAKQLSFNMEASQVETILNNQKQTIFLPGPNQQRQRQQREERGGRNAYSAGFLETIADVFPL